jgi:hypothetical protein
MNEFTTKDKARAVEQAIIHGLAVEPAREPLLKAMVTRATGNLSKVPRTKVGKSHVGAIYPEACPISASISKASKGMATNEKLGSKRSGIIATSITVVLASRGKKPDARGKRPCKQSKGHFYRSSKPIPGSQGVEKRSNPV